MAKTKILWISIAALSVIGVLTLGLTLAFIPAIRTFAQAPTPQPTPGVSVKNTWSVYEESFMSAFAARLGVTADKVKEAFSGAFSDTLDQAVKDGKITQAEADQMKSDFTNRFDQGSLPGFPYSPLVLSTAQDLDRWDLGLKASAKDSWINEAGSISHRSPKRSI